MRKVKQIAPVFHVDISSILYFSITLSAFLPVRFYDYRPAALKLENLECGTADLKKLPFADNEIQSLSCMHTVEHIGLGRYGEPIDFNGDSLAINELQRVVATNGFILFVVPIGKPAYCFNAHRIYSYADIVNRFSKMHLLEFSLIPDNGTEVGLIYNASEEQANVQEYGCGCFLFKKK